MIQIKQVISLKKFLNTRILQRNHTKQVIKLANN